MKAVMAMAWKPFPNQMMISGAMATMGDGLQEDRVRVSGALDQRGLGEEEGDEGPDEEAGAESGEGTERRQADRGGELLAPVHRGRIDGGGGGNQEGGLRLQDDCFADPDPRGVVVPHGDHDGEQQQRGQDVVEEEAGKPLAEPRIGRGRRSVHSVYPLRSRALTSPVRRANSGAARSSGWRG
jgi:hypothetical protein